MKPIQGYDLINEAGEFKRLPAGIYPIVITNIIDRPEGEYLEIYVDIAKGDYKDYFKTAVENGLKDTSRSIRSYKTNALPFFKAFITAIEKSNPGYQWDWDESKLIGKKAVGIFAEEEYLKDGQVKLSTKLYEVRSFEAYQAGKLSVPPIKRVYAETVAPAMSEVAEQFDNNAEAPTLLDDDFPF